MDNHLPEIFYFPNCVDVFSHQYSQSEFDKMEKDFKKGFSLSVFPIIKHRWKKSFVVMDDGVLKLNLESSVNGNKIKKKIIITRYPESVNFKLKTYTIGNLKITFECYSYLMCRQVTDTNLFDEYILRGLVEGGNALKIFSKKTGHVKSTIGIFGNDTPFLKVPLMSLKPLSQQKIFNAWISNKPVILTGGTGVGKTSQVPKLLLWFNYLFGGFKNLNKISSFNEKQIVLSLPRVTLVKLHSKTLLSSIGFNKIDSSPISLKFGSMPDSLINTNPKPYGLVFSTHKLTISKLFRFTKQLLIDEVHEHDPIGDIIISILNKKYNMFNSLFLMTATLEDDRERINNFFTNPLFIHIPGGTLYNISEVYIKNALSFLNKYEYVEEEKKNIFEAIKKYTPLKSFSGIIFVSSVSQCEEYKKYLSQRFPYDFYIIHGKVLNIDEMLKKIYSNLNVSIIISTPYLESSVTIYNATHIYDTGRVYIPAPFGGKETFISKSMMEQRKGRVGRVRPGLYIYFYDILYLKPIKKIDFEFLHNYVLYGKYYDLDLANDLFIIPSNLNNIKKTEQYIDSFNIPISQWMYILCNYYLRVLEYAKIYVKGGTYAKSLDLFERENIVDNVVIDSIKSLNMRAKILCFKKKNNVYILTCEIMFGVYLGKRFNLTYNKPLTGFVLMITECDFIPEY
ncbi:49R [Yaba monkey tumor virus]|uniref:RNA helicase NPH-II n=1 Tax=Yaba monkey tumor virus (strain VR587) TaxID=928314 RepID=Q6TUW4_YMTV5|nr:RNA helicase NPH-II [Yaba monkey tumor virus]AAR07405.1 49R [Yaba monkey tumor virus]